ncbi:hypothetical protein PHAVU_007G081600 [Phaseolus vulgaris]|uniref:Uncharacterized protein n=1 Tax=Phaseolus vulgaris TaxID=3885 RepID=V7BGE0_PHAVU|nr:hypothetical protein PHAVU_007G0816001g [Phaseolus vulgaris]ESW15551.1 hypothetical protein PHAVU_007G0816001g [Phaseolus vulgaris]
MRERRFRKYKSQNRVPFSIKKLSSSVNFSVFDICQTSGCKVVNSFNNQGKGTQDFTDAKIILIGGCCCCCTSFVFSFFLSLFLFFLFLVFLGYWFSQSDVDEFLFTSKSPDANKGFRFSIIIYHC